MQNPARLKHVLTAYSAHSTRQHNHASHCMYCLGRIISLSIEYLGAKSVKGSMHAMACRKADGSLAILGTEIIVGNPKLKHSSTLHLLFLRLSQNSKMVTRHCLKPAVHPAASRTAV